MKSFDKVPNELWAIIKSYLPTLSKHLIGDLKDYEDRPEDIHSRIWSSIFQDEIWLSKMVEIGINPVLVGSDLPYFYNLIKSMRDGTENIQIRPTYLVLVLAHDGDGGQPPSGQPRGYDWHWRSFNPSLQRNRDGPGDYMEYFFPKTGLTLNTSDATNYKLDIFATQPGRLTTRKRGKRQSSYYYWKDDEFLVRPINSDCIIGMHSLRAEKNVASKVGLTWQHLPSKKLRQHCFYPIKGLDRHSSPRLGDNGELLGWEWSLEWPRSRRKKWIDRVSKF